MARVSGAPQQFPVVKRPDPRGVRRLPGRLRGASCIDRLAKAIPVPAATGDGERRGSTRRSGTRAGRDRHGQGRHAHDLIHFNEEKMASASGGRSRFPRARRPWGLFSPPQGGAECRMWFFVDDGAECGGNTALSRKWLRAILLHPPVSRGRRTASFRASAWQRQAACAGMDTTFEACQRAAWRLPSSRAVSGVGVSRDIGAARSGAPRPVYSGTGRCRRAPSTFVGADCGRDRTIRRADPA